MKTHLLYPQTPGLDSLMSDTSCAHTQPFPQAEHGKISSILFARTPTFSNPKKTENPWGSLPPCPQFRLKLASGQDTSEACAQKHCSHIQLHFFKLAELISRHNCA